MKAYGREEMGAWAMCPCCSLYPVGRDYSHGSAKSRKRNKRIPHKAARRAAKKEIRDLS